MCSAGSDIDLKRYFVSRFLRDCRSRKHGRFPTPHCRIAHHAILSAADLEPIPAHVAWYVSRGLKFIEEASAPSDKKLVADVDRLIASLHTRAFFEGRRENSFFFRWLSQCQIEIELEATT